MSSVLFLFLAHLGIGIVFTLLLVGEGAGVKFFRFNAGLAAVLLLVALALRPEASGEALMDSPGLTALVVATGALLFYWASIGRGLARIRPDPPAAALDDGYRWSGRSGRAGAWLLRR